MIYREKILAALNAQKSGFALFQSELGEQMREYRRALDRLNETDCNQLTKLLEGSDASGALPVEEPNGSITVAFEQAFRNHEEARRWAYDTLIGRTTFAADGSQILPSRDYSLPVAAVQVGWFENHHLPGVPYVKDAAFEILTPAEVMVRTGGETEASEQIVHQRRYAMESSAIKNYMRAKRERGFDESRPPVVFFDSLLVISFAELLPPDQREFYVSEIISLLDISRQTAIPVVGYIDTSYARDLVNMLQTAFALADSPRIADGPLLADRMKWGDRTLLFRCARRGILESYPDEWRRGIGFVYLKTTGDRPPSRVDLPMWVYERGLLDYVIDTVRGEVIVGNGYPYALESADQTAVISQRDREMFYAVFQEFAEREGLDLRIARKAVSKTQRR
ncbi:MAG: DNA double-strand break repair nuclease NurA [Acidobacteriota bacterium]